MGTSLQQMGKSLREMDETLQVSGKTTATLAAATERQLALFESQQSVRLALQARKIKLAQLHVEYYSLAHIVCTPANIGKRSSGAAETPESCNEKFVAWEQRVTEYLCESDANYPQCVAFRFAPTMAEKDAALVKIIESLGP